MPGLLMPLVRMYVPSHIPTHQLGPVLGLALMGALASPFLLRRV